MTPWLLALAGCWVSTDQIREKIGDTGDAGTCTRSTAEERLVDGSFEGGTPSEAWDEESLLFDSPLCDPERCSSTVGYHARSGSWWAWFGGVEEQDTSLLTQRVVFNPGPLDLSLWVWVPTFTTDPDDRLVVLVDGNAVFEVEGPYAAPYADGYVEVTANLETMADGFEHTISIVGSVQGTAEGISNFFVDDVSLMGCP